MFNHNLIIGSLLLATCFALAENQVTEKTQNISKYWNETCTQENLKKMFGNNFVKDNESSCYLALYSEIDNSVPELKLAFKISAKKGLFDNICTHFKSEDQKVGCFENKIASIQIESHSKSFYQEIEKKYGASSESIPFRQGKTLASDFKLHQKNSDGFVYSAAEKSAYYITYYIKYFSPKLMDHLNKVQQGSLVKENQNRDKLNKEEKDKVL